MISKKKANYFLDTMEEMFPNAECELVHRNEFELLIAVLLSAQTTDEAVNKVTPNLFMTFPTPASFCNALVEDIENKIRRIGLYRNKAKHIKQLSSILVNDFNSQVPTTQKELESLPGVGRKTANVVRSVAFNEPAIAVDTHVERISKRLGMANEKDTPLEVEKKLMSLIPIDRWTRAHHLIIFFGRYHCLAKNPKCSDCPLKTECKYYRKTYKNQV